MCIRNSSGCVRSWLEMIFGGVNVEMAFMAIEVDEIMCEESAR